MTQRFTPFRTLVDVLVAVHARVSMFASTGGVAGLRIADTPAVEAWHGATRIVVLAEGTYSSRGTFASVRADQIYACRASLTPVIHAVVLVYSAQFAFESGCTSAFEASFCVHAGAAVLARV